MRSKGTDVDLVAPGDGPRRVTASTQRKETAVLLTGLAFLALFSLISIVAVNEDPRERGDDPSNEIWLRTHHGYR
jgi:hypothetical protein